MAWSARKLLRNPSLVFSQGLDALRMATTDIAQPYSWLGSLYWFFFFAFAHLA